MLPPLMVFVKSEHPIAVLFQAQLPSFSLKVLPRFPPSHLKVTLSKQNSNTTKYLESIRREMALDTPLPYMKTYLVLSLLQFREHLCHKNSLEDRNSDLRMNYYAFAIPSVPRGCQILTYSWSDLHVYKAHRTK